MRIVEVFGLSPAPLRAREAWLAIRGSEHLPRSRFDASSLGILKPRLALRTWLGQRAADRRVPIVNLFNRTPTPPHEGWSVRRSQVRDFRGRALTYDSHNGTDFGVPVGTTVVAPAPGRVLRISSELHRGGLKVFLDHGGGLFTTSNHLGRALVRVGDVVERGQPIALSAYSGLDAVVTFPWGVPHVHFNVWLGGAYVDPFAAPGEIALWRGGNEPGPAIALPGETYGPTRFDRSAVEEAIRACKDEKARAEMERGESPDGIAMNVLFFQNYFPTLFPRRFEVVAETRAREAVLDLPFGPEDCSGVTFAD